MTKKTAMTRFLTVITIVITSMLFCTVFLSSEDQKEISFLEIRVDSLINECNKKDTLLHDATITAIQLSDHLNRLYEISPETHKKLFSETD